MRNKILDPKFTPPLLLILFSLLLYYKFFIFGLIPFPGDLMVASYSPWFDYFKLPVQNPLISDVFSQIFIWKYLAIDQYKNLEWPLWNPYSFSGTVLLANYQSATLYPLNALLLLPKYLGWGLFIFSQTLITLINMYLLLSSWSLKKLAKLIGAAVFALGGLMTTNLEWGTMVHAMSWLPLSLFAIEKFINTSKTRYLLLLTVSCLMAILAGYAQAIIYSLFIIGGFLLVKAWQHKKEIPLINYLKLIGALFVAFLLAAPQILPTLELLSISIRSKESYIAKSFYGLLPLSDFLRLFIADLFGSPITGNYWGSLNYLESSGFIGSLSLALLIFTGLFLRKNLICWFFIAVFLIATVFTFQNPLSIWLYETDIPLLTSSYASRMLLIITFSSSILLAFSVNQYLTLKDQDRLLFKSLLWSTSVFVGVTLGIYISKYLVNFWGHQLDPSLQESYFRAITPGLANYQVSLRNSIIPIIISSMMLISYYILKIIKLSPSLKSSLMILIFLMLSGFDLTRYFLKFNPFVNSDLVFPQTPALSYLKSLPEIYRLGREHGEILPPNTWSYYKIQSLEGYDPLYIENYGRIINHINKSDIKTADLSRYAELENYSSPFIDAANVKYFVGILRDDEERIPRDTEPSGTKIHYRFNEAGYTPVFKDKSFVVLENPNALERVYFAKSYFYTDEEELKTKIQTAAFDPRSSIGITTKLNLREVTGEGKAEIISYNPNQVIIKSVTKNEELLILADQYSSDWKAKIDGQETEVTMANLIFRGVAVPSGVHTIEFYYFPNSFKMGLYISIITLVLLIFITIYPLLKISLFKRRFF